MNNAITAELSASVWKLLVGASERVEAGQPVVILESMKMEIPVLADVAGTVTHVHVAEGDEVGVGDALVSIES